MLINACESILWQFRSCFSRKAAFAWFVIVVMAFIIRCDHCGVSSVVRWLFLNPDYYDPLLRFFRTTSWQLEPLLASWVTIAMRSFPIPEFNGRLLLIGDTIKVGKEAFKMPGLKLLHQESQNSCTSEFIFGHHFGVVGLLVGSMSKSFCLPLQAEFHEGIDAIQPAQGFNGKPATLVTRMANLLVEKAKQTGRCCYSTVDAYYSAGPLFNFLKTALDEHGRQWVHVITRAKSNYVAFFDWPGACKKYQKKDKVPLVDIFDFPKLFEKAELRIHGKLKNVDYYCIDLLWQPVKDYIRFVLVVDGKDRFILMCSDLDLSPQEIIVIYCYRSKIEINHHLCLCIRFLCVVSLGFSFSSLVFVQTDPDTEIDFGWLFEVLFTRPCFSSCLITVTWPSQSGAFLPSHASKPQANEFVTLSAPKRGYAPTRCGAGSVKI